MYNTLKHFYNLHVYLPAIRYPKLYCPLPSMILVQLNIILKFFIYITVNQQILAAIKFGVSQNKVIYVNLAAIKFGVSHGLSMQCTIDVYVGGDKY